MTSAVVDNIYQIVGAVVAVVALQLLLVTKVVDLSKDGRRRIQHATTGQLLVGVSYVLPLWICTVALLAGILLLLYVFHIHKPWYRKTFGPLLRPSEYDVLPGAFWFLVGTFLTASMVCAVEVIDIDIGRYAVLCLSYADPMAAWVGSSIPSYRVVGTTATVAGCLSAFATAYVLGGAMLGSGNRPELEILIGALACTVTESVPFGNDNLLIPIGTASAVQLIRDYQKRSRHGEF